MPSLECRRGGLAKNGELMKQEQRLLVAFVLIAAILGIWSALMPQERLPAHRPPELETEKKPAILTEKGSEKTEEFKLGRFELGIGETRGGISTLRIDREPLLEKTIPGFLELDSGQMNPQPVRFQNRMDGDLLLSEGQIEGIRILRRIEPVLGDPYRVRCRIQAVNGSQEAKKIYLQLILYKSLQTMDPRHPGTGNIALDGKTVTITVPRGQEKRFPGTPSWVASQGRSHVVIVQIPGKEGAFHVEHPLAGETTGVLELPSREIQAGGQTEWDFPVYIGPMALDSLKQAGLEEALSFGPFSGVGRWLLSFLDWSYNLFHNYGLAICFLSLAVWLPFSPLTWYGRWLSAKTMKQMAQLKPQEARIRKEHQSNPDQMHKELMQLYRKHGVNPASGCIGCLPFLFTWPIYIALFQVLTRAPELRGAHFLWIGDLSAPDGIIPLPFTIPLIGSRLNVLPILATVATYFQQVMMQPPALDMTDEQKAQQEMMKILPLVFLVVFYQLPSGFMLYWVVNSALTVLQQVAADRLAKKRA